MVRLSATEEQTSGSSVCYRRTRRKASDGERLQRLSRDERVAKTKMTRRDNFDGDRNPILQWKYGQQRLQRILDQQ